jgi:hypothetical protein
MAAIPGPYQAPPRAAPSAPGVGAATPGVGELLRRALVDARELVGEFALLAALDARRSAVRLAWLLGAGLAAGLLLATAWIAAVVSAIVYLMGDEATWRAVLALAALLNVAGAAAALWWIRREAHELPFTALLDALRGHPADEPPAHRTVE